MLSIGVVPAVQELRNDQLPMTKSQLLQNSPNPFGAGGTTIQFKVEDAKGKISLKVYDLSGSLVRVLVDESLPTPYSLLPTAVSWDGRDDAGNAVPSGIYFVKLNLMDHPQLVRKAVLLR
jgi:flagellar hook assembly protein FlgD